MSKAVQDVCACQIVFGVGLPAFQILGRLDEPLSWKRQQRDFSPAFRACGLLCSSCFHLWGETRRPLGLSHG